MGVSFTDDAGNEETLTSAATASVTARPDSAPDAPDLPIGTAVFVGGVDLEWNDVPGADSYEVQLFQNGQWTDLPGGGVRSRSTGREPSSANWIPAPRSGSKYEQETLMAPRIGPISVLCPRQTNLGWANGQAGQRSG